MMDSANSSDYGGQSTSGSASKTASGTVGVHIYGTKHDTWRALFDLYPTSSETLGVPRSSAGVVVVNRRRQQGNPVLKYVRNVRYEWGDCECDFECGKECGVLYLALKYHRLHPNYIHGRLTSDQQYNYKLKIMLCLVNVEEPRHMLREMNLLCHRIQWTLILCYSVEEAGEYIENLKLAENRDPSYQVKKPAVQIDERQALLNAAIGILTGARSVTKSDAKTLLQTFGSLKNVANATEEQLALCPGLGPIRAKNLYNYLRTNLCNQ